MRVTEHIYRGTASGVDSAIPARRGAESSGPRAAATNPMSIEISRRGSGVVVLAVRGEIDICTEPRLREVLWHRLASCARVVVLDLSEVTFCNSAGLQLLEQCRRRAEQREIDFQVVPDRRGLLVRLLDAVG